MRAYQRQRTPTLKPPVKGRAVHPFVVWMWKEINHQRASQEDVATRSGISSSAMRKWRTGLQAPTLVAMEAIINTLGYDLVIRSKKDEETED